MLILRHLFPVRASARGKIIPGGERMAGDYDMFDGIFRAATLPCFSHGPLMFKFFLEILPIRENEKSACSKKNTFFSDVEKEYIRG